mgnify:CR=1 FL=1
MAKSKELIHHSIGYHGKGEALKAKRRLEERGGGPYKLSHKGRLWFVVGPRQSNPDVLDAIKPGMRVTIVNRFGQQQSGKAVMRGPAGWVLNMGGPHGTPGIARPENIVKVGGKPSARSLFDSRIMNPRARKTRDVWVVQGNYGYGHGWEDVTAEETWKEIRQRVKEYRENEPGTPFRVKLTREKIEMGQQNPTRTGGPSAIPTKWTPATVSRKGRQIQIRMGGR